MNLLKTLHYQRLFDRALAPKELMSISLREGDTVIDLGANIGIYAKALSAMVGPKGQVHAVEMMPETFGYLHNNVCRLGNVFCYNAGISGHTGIMRAHQPPRLPGGGGHIYRAHLDPAGQTRVRTYRLDDLFPDLSPRFIKCDVEGEEHSVILSSQTMLKRCRPVWLIETRNAAVFEFMNGYGYRSTPVLNDWIFSPNNQDE